jgi:hypothetical protein
VGPHEGGSCRAGWARRAAGHCERLPANVPCDLRGAAVQRVQRAPLPRAPLLRQVWPLARTPALEADLRTRHLQLVVFDDSQVGMGEGREEEAEGGGALLRRLRLHCLP